MSGSEDFGSLLKVTSQGPGTAMPCALKLVELLFGAPKVGDDS